MYRQQTSSERLRVFEDANLGACSRTQTSHWHGLKRSQIRPTPSTFQERHRVGWGPHPGRCRAKRPRASAFTSCGGSGFLRAARGFKPPNLIMCVSLVAA